MAKKKEDQATPVAKKAAEAEKNKPKAEKKEEPKNYRITVVDRGNERAIDASSCETVLSAFERAGIYVPAR